MVLTVSVIGDRPRAFGSVLGEVMIEHVALMRNRGYKYISLSARLLRFDQFLQLNPALGEHPIEVMLDHWAAAKSTQKLQAQDQRLLVNRYDAPLSVSGVLFKVAGYIKAAAETEPSPHSFRHATAVHLVSAGIDVTVIRSWLGHVSLDTTNHYAKAKLETKRKALEQVSPPATAAQPPSWKRDASLLA